MVSAENDAAAPNKRQRMAAKRAAEEAAAAVAFAEEPQAKKAKREAVEVVDEKNAEWEVVDQEKLKRQLKAARRAAKEATAAAEAAMVAPPSDVDEEEAKRHRKAAKRAAKEAAAAVAFAEELQAKKAKLEAVEVVALAPGKNVESPRNFENEFTVFVRGLPFSATEEAIRAHFDDCGEINIFKFPRTLDGKPRGIAFVKYATQHGFDAALKFHGTTYGGRTLEVGQAGEFSGKGKGTEVGGKGAKGDDESNKVFVRGLPFSVDERAIRKHFGDCGEIKRVWLMKGMAFIQYTAKEGLDAAVTFDNTEFGGRVINVRDACSEKGKGKGGKGQDGKGKGKDTKGERDDTFKVLVVGFPSTITAEILRKDFGEHGDIKSLALPLNEEGTPRGFAFVQYTTKEGMDAALKLDNSQYGDSFLSVRDAAKGKGKGKDGKGQHKNKAKCKATGEKKTFADSDDE